MPITVKTCATLGEAAQALASDRGARFLGGGTLLMRAVNEGDLALATIVRATDRAFTQIRPAGGRIELGAGVTMAQILASRDLTFLHPVARGIGGPAVRSAATVGGNLFAPTPYGDFTAALLALEAGVAIQGGYGGRETPLEEFLAARERGGARPLVASVSFARPASVEAFRFRKMARTRPKGISVVAIAAHLPIVSGRLAGVRIAYGAMAPTPLRARAAERALEGRALDEAAISAACAAAIEGTSPATDAIASDWYRREVLPVQLRRLLLNDPS